MTGPQNGGRMPATTPEGHFGPPRRSPWRRFRGLPLPVQVVCWALAAFLILGIIGAATAPPKKRHVVSVSPSSSTTTTTTIAQPAPAPPTSHAATVTLRTAPPTRIPV